MADMERLEVFYDRKIQLQQFEPITFGANATISLDTDDDPDEVYADVARDLQDAVERELARRIATAKQDDRGE